MDTTSYQIHLKNSISTNDLVACAPYFDQIMNIVIDVLMGWDRKLQCPTTTTKVVPVRQVISLNFE
jgi:hypothetical protein